MTEGIHINRPSSFTWHAEMKCRRCRLVVEHIITSFVWYGPITTCTNCGAYINDGHLRRKTKRDAYRAMEARNRLAVPSLVGTCDDFKAWLAGQLGGLVQESTANPTI